MNDELIREVNEAMKQHQFQQFWKKTGKPLMGMVAVGLVCLAVLVYWQQDQRSKQQAQSDVLLRASAWMQQQTAEGDAQALALLMPLEADGARAQIRTLFLQTLARRGQHVEASMLTWPEAAQPDLAMVNCLIQQAQPEAPDCELSESLASLAQEFQAVALMHQGELQQALAQLPDEATADFLQQRRLSDMRAYLTSSMEVDAPVAPPPAAEAQPDQPASASGEASHDDAETITQ